MESKGCTCFSLLTNKGADNLSLFYADTEATARQWVDVLSRMLAGACLDSILLSCAHAHVCAACYGEGSSGNAGDADDNWGGRRPIRNLDGVSPQRWWIPDEAADDCEGTTTPLKHPSSWLSLVSQAALQVLV